MTKQVQKAHLKLSQFNTTFTYRGKTWIDLYKTYIKPSLLYASEAWKPTTQEGIDKLEGVQKRVIRMAGRQGEGSYMEACRGVGMNTIKEELEEAEMVRVYRKMYGHDKLEKTKFSKMEEAREGAASRRFLEKEVRRTLANERKPIRKRSFAN